MRILFSCGDFYPSLGGATSLVDDLSRTLAAQGHEVTVLSRQWPGMPSSEKRVGYEIFRLDYPLEYEKFDFSEALVDRSGEMLGRIHRLISEHRIETVCIGLLDMSALYFLLLRQVIPFRLVVYLHGGDVRKLPHAEPSYAKLLRGALRAADAIIAVSAGVARDAAGWLPEADAKTHVIVNGIDLELLTAAPPWVHPRAYIGFCGRLVWEKDAGTLIRAFGAAQAGIADVDLVLVGGGPEESKLRNLAAACPQPDRIHFLGRAEREAALGVIRGALFLVLPSLTEGFPIAAVEALAAGKPVIGSRVTGTSSLIQDGVNGVLFAPGDVSALSGLLREYLLDRPALERLSAGARATDVTRFDIRLLARDHLRVYGEAA